MRNFLVGKFGLILHNRYMKHKLDILFFFNCGHDFKWLKARPMRNEAGRRQAEIALGLKTEQVNGQSEE